MTRPIKFRAWTPRHKIMNPDVCLCRCESDWIIMQFTGLLDRHGTEIYEGDVLATSNNGKDGADVWEREIIGEVYWNDKFACWNHRIALGDDDSIYALRYIEILGNIYEHPELVR